MTAISLTINGQAHGPIEVRDDLSMNDFLREVLGMTGTKFGCGAAQCLSCVVIVDAPDGTSFTNPTCIAPAVNFAGKKIRTVEGLANNGTLHPLQRSFMTHHGLQCGFCTPGFLMLATNTLEQRPNIADDELLDVLSSNLCRCTGYQNIIKAVKAARDEMQVTK